VSGLLSWDAARDKVLNALSPLAPHEIPVAEAFGLSLAGSVTAPEAMPPFDNSAMDGFAVRAEDTFGANENRPVALRVAGVLPAGGSRAPEVTAGLAVRIMTGAPIPPGADAVVPVEDTNFWIPGERRARTPEDPAEAADLRVSRPARSGQNVRRSGESVPAGAIFLEPGHRLGSAEIGLLISVGVKLVNVHPLPRVGVLSTGDELVAAAEDPGPGKIRDSNRPSLLLRLREHGFPGVDLGLVQDNEAELERRITAALPGLDFLLTSGGVSVGDFDFTRRVLARLGAVEAYAVAVKPGKPQVFGRVAGVPVFGLPGNPVSSLVVFDQFVVPGLRRLAGQVPEIPEWFPVTLTQPLRHQRGRTEFVRVLLALDQERWTATPTGPQGSGILSSLTRANGYVRVPADADSLEPGTRLPGQWTRRAGVLET